MITISPRRSFDHAELGDKAGAALLRHDQHLAVGIVEAAVGHRAIGGIEMHRHADLRRHIAVAAERHDAFDEIGRLRAESETATSAIASASPRLR